MEVFNRFVPLQLSRAVRLVWASNRGWSLASIGLLIVQAFLALAALGLLKLIIDAVVAAVASTYPLDATGEIAVLVGLAAVVALFTSISAAADNAVGEIQSDLVRDHMHSLIHAKAVQVDLAYYENAEYFNTLHRVQIDAPIRAANILTSLLQIGRSGFILLAIAGMLFIFQWWILLVLIVGELPGALVRIYSAWVQYRWERKSTPRARRASYFSLLLSSRYPAQEVRLFGLSALFINRFNSFRKQMRDEHRQLIIKKVKAESIAQFATALTMFVIFGFIAYEALRESITLGDLGMYFAAVQRGRGNLRELLYGIASFYQNSLFLAELSDFLSLEQKIVDPSNPLPVPRPLKSGISVEHINFAYPGISKLALEDVNITFRPGERIAIVGPNGSGKTTLVKLLCRLYKPDSGNIMVDGIPLSNFRAQEWFDVVSVFLQDHGKYFLSARENIGFGSREPMDNDEPIIAAAEVACVVLMYVCQGHRHVAPHPIYVPLTIF